MATIGGALPWQNQLLAHVPFVSLTRSDHAETYSDTPHRGHRGHPARRYRPPPPRSLQNSAPTFP